MTELTEVGTAEKTVADLEDKRRLLVERAVELDAERQKISFAAHTGDAKARAKLDKINTETATHASEVASVEAAIKEANIRLNEARHAANLVADRANAQQVLSLFDEFCNLGCEVDAALEDAAANAVEMEQVLQQMHLLGAARPTSEQLRALGELAVKTTLMTTPWRRGFDHLAPNQRRSFASLVEQWRLSIMPELIARIGDAAKQKNEAA